MRIAVNMSPFSMPVYTHDAVPSTNMKKKIINMLLV